MDDLVTVLESIKDDLAVLADSLDDATERDQMSVVVHLRDQVRDSLNQLSTLNKGGD